MSYTTLDDNVAVDQTAAAAMARRRTEERRRVDRGVIVRRFGDDLLPPAASHALTNVHRPPYTSVRQSDSQLLNSSVVLNFSSALTHIVVKTSTDFWHFFSVYGTCPRSRYCPVRL